MKLMFIVPRTSGGGAEKVITALASRMAEKHEVYLIPTLKDNGKESYPISPAVKVINLYDLGEKKLAGECQEGGGATAGNQCSGSAQTSGSVREFAARVKRAIAGVFVENAGRMPVKAVENAVLRSSETLEARRINDLKELKEELGIECAVSFLNSANYLNVMSCAGERTIVSIRSYPSGRYAPADCTSVTGKRNIKVSCEKADVIVPVSKETGKALADDFGAPPEKLHVIYNPVDVDGIEEQGGAEPDDKALLEKIETADIVYATSGRLTFKKGQWHIVRAFRKVVDKYPGALLVILGREGNGSENTAGLIGKAVEENGLGENVALPGFFMNPYALLSRTDVYVMASYNEGFPNALMDAMALGIPVISADSSSGPREILAPDTDYAVKCDGIEQAEYGMLVPVCSGNKASSADLEPEEEALAEAMLSLAGDAELRRAYGGKARNRAEAFRTEIILDEWERIIQEEPEATDGSDKQETEESPESAGAEINEK